VDELPHRAIIDLQPAPGEFGHQPAQGEIRLPATLHQPIAVRPRNLLRPIAADLIRLDAAGLVETPHPVDRRTDRYAKLGRCLMARQATLGDSPYYPFSKII
jgi:hypothetical protein